MLKKYHRYTYVWVSQLYQSNSIKTVFSNFAMNKKMFMLYYTGKQMKNKLWKLQDINLYTFKLISLYAWHVQYNIMYVPATDDIDYMVGNILSISFDQNYCCSSI